MSFVWMKKYCRVYLLVQPGVQRSAGSGSACWSPACALFSHNGFLSVRIGGSVDPDVSFRGWLSFKKELRELASCLLFSLLLITHTHTQTGEKSQSVTQMRRPVSCSPSAPRAQSPPLYYMLAYCTVLAPKHFKTSQYKCRPLLNSIRNT